MTPEEKTRLIEDIQLMLEYSHHMPTDKAQRLAILAAHTIDQADRPAAPSEAAPRNWQELN